MGVPALAARLGTLMVSLAQDAALDGMDPRQLKLLLCRLQPYSDT